MITVNDDDMNTVKKVLYTICKTMLLCNASFLHHRIPASLEFKRYEMKFPK